MSKDKLPAGWDGERVRRTIDYCERKTEDEAVAEDEVAIESSETVMSVPHKLVSKVRELIVKRQR